LQIIEIKTLEAAKDAESTNDSGGQSDMDKDRK